MKGMKRAVLLPNFITALGLACGLFIVFKTGVVDASESLQEYLRISSILLVIAGVADLIDGFVARATGAESEFGAFFDSLSDAITFGVAPASLMIKSLSYSPKGTPLSFFVMMAAMLYSICGVLRLVRFNTKKSKAQTKKDKKKQFTGLPIPAAAAAAVSVNFLMISDLAEKYVAISTPLRAKILIMTMVLVGYLMVSRWKFPSAKALQLRVAPAPLIIWTVLIGLVTIYAAIYYFPLVLFLLSWGYVLVGWILSIIRLILGRKSKSLEGFYPDGDVFEDD